MYILYIFVFFSFCFFSFCFLWWQCLHIRELHGLRCWRGEGGLQCRHTSLYLICLVVCRLSWYLDGSFCLTLADADQGLYPCRKRKLQVRDWGGGDYLQEGAEESRISKGKSLEFENLATLRLQNQFSDCQ